MWCLHKWKEIKEPEERYASKRVCLKCGRREKEVWEDTAFTGNIPNWKLDKSE